MRCQGSTVFPYLEDWLLIDWSHQYVRLVTGFLIQLLIALGVCINEEKSVLLPTWSINFIGAKLDSVSRRAFLSSERYHAMSNQISHITHRPWTTVHKCLSLLGMHLPDFFCQTPLVVLAGLAPLDLSTMQEPHRLHQVIVPARVVTSLTWWLNLEKIMVGVPFSLFGPRGHHYDGWLPPWVWC